MILIPIYFLYFYYQMQKFKKGRDKFNQDFMASRRMAMDLAVHALKRRKTLDEEIAQRSGVSESIKKPYLAWVRDGRILSGPPLGADGTFEEMVRSVYRQQTDYLLALNRLGALEKDLYAAIKPNLADTPEAAEIIAVIEERSRAVRRDMAAGIFA